MRTSIDDGFGLVLVATKILHENGHDTSGTLAAVDRLAKRLGISARLVPTWGELFLLIDGSRLRAIDALPGNINMNRVVATLRIVDEFEEGSLAAPEAAAALNEAAWPSPAATSNTTVSFGRQTCATRNCLTRW
jgi:uncharacterized membrane protein YjjP (DUF1212 family)